MGEKPKGYSSEQIRSGFKLKAILWNESVSSAFWKCPCRFVWCRIGHLGTGAESDQAGTGYRLSPAVFFEPEVERN